MTIGAVVSMLAAGVPGARAELSAAAAGPGLAAIAAHGTARTRSDMPCAAVAWRRAGSVAGILSRGLGEDYPFG